MTRRPDWERRLADYLAGCSGARFLWGRLDCALFAAGAVLAMTGTDPAATYRGRYSTATGAARALRRYGQGTLEATIDALFPERPIGFARRGDLVLHNGAVGVCVGDRALFVGEEGGSEGLVAVPRAEWSKAWGVGP